MNKRLNKWPLWLLLAVLGVAFLLIEADRADAAEPYSVELADEVSFPIDI
ncbi:MAG: hypothetical protein ACR2PW_07740 [Gammaproteobacteria bacterium]